MACACGEGRGPGLGLALGGRCWCHRAGWMLDAGGWPGRAAPDRSASLGRKFAARLADQWANRS